MGINSPQKRRGHATGLGLPVPSDKRHSVSLGQQADAAFDMGGQHAEIRGQGAHGSRAQDAGVTRDGRLARRLGGGLRPLCAGERGRGGAALHVM